MKLIFLASFAVHAVYLNRSTSGVFRLNNTLIQYLSGLPIVFFIKAWGAARCVSKEDWMEWLRRLSVELLKESPSPALRSCWATAQTYPPLARYATCDKYFIRLVFILLSTSSVTIGQVISLLWFASLYCSYFTYVFYRDAFVSFLLC